jgi:hypothetical protein
VPSCTSTSACGGSCGGEGRSCDDDSKCASGVCADEGNYGCFLDDCACVATCCNDGDCKSSGGGSCAWVVETDSDGTSVILRSCAQPGQLPSGTGCSLDAGAETCAGGSCLRFPNQTGPLCTQPCCRDSDCAGIGGDGGAAWTCAPFDQEVGGGAIIALLVCEPPPSR